MYELQQAHQVTQQVGAEKIAYVNVQQQVLKTNGGKLMETVKGNLNCDLLWTVSTSINIEILKGNTIQIIFTAPTEVGLGAMWNQ